MKRSTPRMLAGASFPGMLTLLASCGGSLQAAGAPASSAPSIASLPAASSPAAPASPTAAPSAPASGATSATGGVKLTLAPNSSHIDIRMRELLAGHATKSDAVESTQAISGALLLSPKGAVLPGSKLELELSALSSDRDRRDNFIKRSVLETSRYPNVEFVPKQAQGLDGLPPASGQVTFKLLGDATVHGVTKPMTWDVTAQCSGQGCNGTATSSFTLTEFGMTPPRIGPVLEVEDQGRLELRFQAARSVA